MGAEASTLKAEGPQAAAAAAPPPECPMHASQAAAAPAPAAKPANHPPKGDASGEAYSSNSSMTTFRMTHKQLNHRILESVTQEKHIYV